MKDVRGVDLGVGQIVGVAERDGNVARMRFGVVVSLSPKSDTVGIRWEDGYVHGAKVSNLSRTGAEVDRPRFIVVG